MWGPGWRFHAMHHSPKRLYWLNAGRTQVVEIVVDAFVEGLVTKQLGMNRDQLVANQAVRFMYGNLQHTNVDLRSGVLDHVFSTPDLHRWHHSTVYEEGDANFGVFTSIWDRLFGTFYRPDDRECPDEIGVGRMPDFPTRFVELQRVPIDWSTIRDRNTATWYGEEPQTSGSAAAQTNRRKEDSNP
ncbi:sterol desaturase family protein [Actinospongicola halichondriae]|uniref:sterol desaturase family protein n=1 Tax=Actinospongicola halichondriae TaxID=3236844 RepID=UPI003D4F15A2